MIEKKKRISDQDFIELCKEGSVEEVREAIMNGADVNARNDSDRTPLRVACGYNNVEVVRVLLQAGADPNARYFENWTLPMFIAADEDIDIEIFKMLLDAGADVNAKSEYSHTALGRCIQHSGRIDVVKLLLEAGAKINVPCPYGSDFFEHGGGDALGSAVYKPAIFNLILQYGGDVNQNDGKLLREAAACGDSVRVKMLLDAGANANIRDQQGITPLLAAAHSKRTSDASDVAEVINLLLDAGADPNVTEYGLTPLDYARHHLSFFCTQALERLEKVTKPVNPIERTSFENFMKLLVYGTEQEIEEAIKAGADVNARDKKGNTPMRQILMCRSTVDFLQILLAAGADINEKGGEANESLLMMALSYWPDPSPNSLPEGAECDYDIIKFLIESGADVNARDDNGRTALMVAALRRDPEVVRLLLEAGADVNVRDKNGRTALWAASRSQYPETMKILLDAGIEANVKDKDGGTALNEAVLGYSNSVILAIYPEVIDMLLKAGLDVNAKAQDGETALVTVLNESYNPPRKRNEIVRMLLSAGADVNVQGKDSICRWEISDGRTPLMIAVARRYPENMTIEGRMVDIDLGPELVKILLDSGADVNVQAPDGWTALMIAAHCENPHAVIINMLLDAGADVDAECEGLRALDYLKANEAFTDKETLERLEKMTSKPASGRRIGNKELEKAVNQNSTGVVRVLLEAGVNPDIRENDGD